MDDQTVDLAKAIGRCATTLGVEIDLDAERGPEALLRAAGVCNRRVCPFCEWRRSRAWRRRFFQGLPKFHSDFPTYKPIFLTLTVKNCRLADLRDTISQMNKSWTRLTKLALFPSNYWFRRTEVTLHRSMQSEMGGDYYVHPHMHILLMVPASYFSRDYIKQSEWQKAWMMSARLDYVPQVNVKRARASSSSGGASSVDTTGAALEVSKYATKATDLINMGSALGEYHHQVKGLRLSASSTGLKPYIADSPIDESELTDKGESPAGNYVYGTAVWFEDIGEYLFSDIS
jgi:plasmid rolling circle replication initiator protein Rep